MLRSIDGASGPAADAMHATVRWRGWIGVLVVAGFALQAMLWLNPGYFSHDELQWGAFSRADSLAELPWVSWTAIETFQFRPLTFNLWLLLSHALFDSPQWFHAAFVALGTLNALLLFVCVARRFGPAAGLAAGLLFLLHPVTAAVHGWVATLADLIWLAALLAIVALADAPSMQARRAWLFVIALLSTGLALLAKEAAISIPALLAIGWWASGRSDAFRITAIAATVAALVYLGLRLGPIDAGASQGSYAYSLLSIPQRLVEYFLYPWMVSRGEPIGLLRHASWSSLLWTLLLLGSFAAALWRVSPRWLGYWAVAGCAALGPTLLLSASSNQYAYGFAAVTAAAAAVAWLRGGRQGRLLLALPLAVIIWHGLAVQSKMLAIGRLQQALYADLQAELAADDATVRLLPPAESRWIYERLTHAVPSYLGTPIGSRVALVDSPALASHRIDADGRLTALSAAVSP